MVSLAAEESITGQGGRAGKQTLEQPRPARLSAASDCADAMSPRRDAARETVSCSRREGVILGGSGTSRVNHSSGDFFLV